MLFSKTEVIYLCNMVWKAVNVAQMVHSEMFDGEVGVKGMCRHEEKMSYQSIGNVCFTQKRAEVMGAAYTILKAFADPVRFPKNLLEKYGLPGI